MPLSSSLIDKDQRHQCARFVMNDYQYNNINLSVSNMILNLSWDTLGIDELNLDYL